jgi:hypothetical protein
VLNLCAGDIRGGRFRASWGSRHEGGDSTRPLRLVTGQ